MGEIGFYPAGFYVWWMFINGMLCFFEVLFLQNVAGVRRRSHAFACLFVNCALTFFAMYLQSSGMCRLILHTGVIFSFAVFSMKLKAYEAVAPVAVILTLYTFMEGFQTVFMSRLVQKDMGARMGTAVQLLVTGLLAVVMAGSLYVLSRRLAQAEKERKSSYMLILGSLREAKSRNERYRAFQHDIDNHLLVLSGLVYEKRYAEAENYSKNLSSLSDNLAARIDTGNLAADVLLKEKVGMAEAKGIQVSCDVHFSKRFYIEDADLCVILANAMDNAIYACAKVKNRPEITVRAGMRRHFLFINVVNTDSPSEESNGAALYRGGQSPFREKDYGTGLKNIRRTVKKYKGTMEAKRSHGRFSLSAALCLEPSGKEERPSGKGE